MMGTRSSEGLPVSGRHGAAGAGRFGAEKHLVDAALLDGGF